MTTSTKAPVRETPNLDSLYCINEDGSRRTIHPADVRGRYQTRKKLVWSVLFLIYVLLPWLKINGKPAVMIDLPSRHFYLFGNTFNAQDFWIAFFVLSGIGFSLIVISALFGRIWCGYACPQTVFLEGFFRRVERWLEGSAQAQKKLEAQPWNAGKVARRGLKWAIYLAFSLFLSHTFLAYFLGVDELFLSLVSSPSRHPTAFVFTMIFSAIIYLNFAWFREQLCIVICPYGRLQGVLYDQHTINVGYDKQRGDPRGRPGTAGVGDCIDCYRCVAVCPTGIDIRNGTQLECIGCANCVDACDDVMAKLGRDSGLVRYDSMAGFSGERRRFVRPRLGLYAFLLALGATVMVLALSRRQTFEANFLRTSGSAYKIEGETITNSYSIHLVNKQPATAKFFVEPIQADPSMRLTIAMRNLELPSFGDQHVPVFAQLPETAFKPPMKVRLRVHTKGAERIIEAPFLGPTN